MQKKIIISILSICSIVAILLLIFEPLIFIYSYHLSFNYFFLISAGALFVFYLFEIINSHWQTEIEESLISLFSILPYFIPAYIIILFDNLIINSIISFQLKANDFSSFYTNPLFLTIRQLICIFILSLISLRARRNLKKNKNRAGVIFLLITISILISGIDFSLLFAPNWFSSIWSLYYLSIGILLSLSFWTLTLSLNRHKFEIIVIEKHKHNLGKILFTFSFLWFYLFFVQYLIIQYTNMSFESDYFLIRLQNGWSLLFYISLLAIFLFPLGILLFDKLKKKLIILCIVSISIVFGVLINLYWIIFPLFFQSFNIKLLLSIFIFILFGLSFLLLLYNKKQII